MPTTTPVPNTTTRPSRVVSGALAVGELDSCRRAPGGVLADVVLHQRTGSASRFQVTVGLIDAQNQVFSQGVKVSSLLARNASATVQVLVPANGSVTGSCQLLGVTAV